jgi:magnesium chelatase family protein
MTLGRTQAVALQGLLGSVIDIECDIADGIPMYSLLGLPDASLQESRDRVRAALTNTGQKWPNKKVTVSLSPAWLPKSGPGFDVAIALAMLVAEGILPQAPLEGAVILGELALDGSIRPVRGALPSLIAGLKAGIKRAIVPRGNQSEAELLEDIEILAFDHLSEIYRWLLTGEYSFPTVIQENIARENELLDFADVAGQPRARYAAEVAATGGHHLLLIGPPGAGKTMIASRLPTILPLLTQEESLEVTAIHSIADGLSFRSAMSRMAPIVAPHHSASRASIVGGGGRTIVPGAISLANRGVLFIDEAPECAAGILDSLRQPLESGEITIARQIGSVTFPARFLLVLAANPCPCGKFTGKGRGCTCSSLQVRRYLGKLSGPLMDRIDIRVTVDPVGRVDLDTRDLGESSDVIRSRVIAARAIAAKRFKDQPWKLNSEIPARALRLDYRPEKAAMNFLHDELDKESITARGLHKTIRLAWTLADLERHQTPTLTDVQRAFQLREGMEY